MNKYYILLIKIFSSPSVKFTYNSQGKDICHFRNAKEYGTSQFSQRLGLLRVTGKKKIGFKFPARF